MNSLTTILRSCLPLAGLLAAVAFTACDLPDKDLGDDPAVDTDTDGGDCQDGDTMMQDCNTCTCENGAWSCTEIGCGDGSGDGDSGDSGDMACDPATKPVDECDVCECQAGEWVCPAIGCAECEPGDTMMQECNECVCDGGFWACDDQACLPPPVMECGAPGPGDAYFFDDVFVTGDILTLSVSYGGGCGTHDFVSCWSGVFAESNPVQTDLEVVHFADDPCEAIEAQDVQLDLAPIRDAWNASFGPGSGTVVVQLAGYGPVDYSF